jgi:putative PIN family toxin of toxin-antitoxin system
MMRVLLDTNILISYLLNRMAASPITRVVEAGILGEFTLLLPEALLEEFSTKIPGKPYLAKRITPAEMKQFTNILLAHSETIPKITETIPAVTRDPKDDYLLAYAVVGEADFLVSGDEDLFVLGQVQGVRICRPRDFLEQLPSS